MRRIARRMASDKFPLTSLINNSFSYHLAISPVYTFRRPLSFASYSSLKPTWLNTFNKKPVYFYSAQITTNSSLSFPRRKFILMDSRLRENNFFSRLGKNSNKKSSKKINYLLFNGIIFFTTTYFITLLSLTLAIAQLKEDMYSKKEEIQGKKVKPTYEPVFAADQTILGRKKWEETCNRQIAIIKKTILEYFINALEHKQTEILKELKTKKISLTLFLLLGITVLLPALRKVNPDSEHFTHFLQSDIFNFDFNLKEIFDSPKEQCLTPLHWVSAKQMPSHLEVAYFHALIQSGEHLESVALTGHTALSLATSNNYISTRYLLESAANKNIIVARMNLIEYVTLLNFLQPSEKYQKIKILLKEHGFKEINEELLIAKRRFATIFNIKKLNNNQIKDIEIACGYAVEGYLAIHDAIKEFVSNQTLTDLDLDHQHWQQIEDRMTAPENNLPILGAGHVSHYVGITLEEVQTKDKDPAVTEKFSYIGDNDFNPTGLRVERINGFYKLIIADRGDFYRAWSDGSFPQPCAASLLISEEHVPYTLDLIEETKHLGRESASIKFFQELPKTVNSNYQDISGTETSKGFKNLTCYYSNIKALFKAQLADKFGPEKGNKIYKNATVFFREKALRDYKNALHKAGDHSQDHLLAEAEKEVQRKREKLLIIPH